LLFAIDFENIIYINVAKNKRFVNFLGVE